MRPTQEDVDLCIKNELEANKGNPFLDQFSFVKLSEVQRSVRWLNENAKESKSFFTKSSSYGFKHDVEREIPPVEGANNYVSNNSFIIAARFLGIRMRPCSGGINRELAIKLINKW